MTMAMMTSGGTRLVAVILAGGAGARMGTTGAQIPKVYLPVGLEPVINRPVSRALEMEEVERIFVLTRKEHPDLFKVDLKHWADTWQKLWYPNEKRIEIEYEEDIHETIDGKGALVALAKIAGKFAGDPKPPSHVLILAGDNFIDRSIEPMLRASREARNDVIIATRRIANRALARRRFGVAQLVGASRQVIDYEEKPEEPRSPNVSIGLYVFPFKEIRRIGDYFKHVSTLELEKEREDKRGAPGYFLEWLVKNKTSVRAVDFSEGTWVDVGTPSSFLTTIVHMSRELIERPQSTRDLDVLGSTENLSDRYYFLCHQAEITNDGNSNSISLYFQGSDAIATLNANAADDKRVIAVKSVRGNRNKNEAFWSAVRGKGARFSTPGKPKRLEAPVLISGGVFLIDPAGEPHYTLGDALVPLFVRDFGAPVDAGRLTTAAGRMDKLDLMDVCVSELAEEMIFFGESQAGGMSHILVCAPPEWQALARDTALSQLVEKRILVPGIDSKRIEIDRRKPAGLTNSVLTNVLPPPSQFNWRVRILYRDSDQEEFQLRHEYKDLILIPDRPSATLEFRALWLSSITTANVGNAPLYNKETASLGRLLGIVDGDGYSRTALLVHAHELVSYVDATKERPIAETMFASDREDGPALKIVAATDGHTGRFSSSERRLPVAPLTTSVYWFTEILRYMR